MALLYLIRHGHASSTWEPGDWDPGLSELGRAQAEARAELLARQQPLALVSSPLRRARETAAPLERRWKTVAAVEPRVSEIRADGVVPEKRRDWLRGIMQHSWSEIAPPESSLHRWRDDVLQALLGIAQDTVVFTHSVAINVAVGFALRNDRVTCFRPANGACTLVETELGLIRVLELGEEEA